ncbi:hypothetical protein RY831_16240 [Noviherbaspirillum sp. CPCC 100848]|uniref:Uncharacterized protein n=1 Tax=Noviherbaspirillum album TaxID=3080276 RepID=A0ABU6JAN6_9BURK|nr:hypothetical protein [Noviherbaspirillum sp. CPCC 100848]MEC4720714.1 hypothetical protein [Noviherbaspirillum sp. CPCC 100848]
MHLPHPFSPQQKMSSEVRSSEVHTTDLAARLGSDNSQQYRRQLLADLGELRAELECAMQRGLPRAQYEKWAAALTAVMSAQAAVKA